ncbi:MAG: hypothetical protein R3B99_16535 [Polyangiales bacterium]
MTTRDFAGGLRPLLVPVLAFNLAFYGALPDAFQAETFWRDIPPAIALPENVLRILVLVILPLFLLRDPSPSARRRLGVWLYVGGQAIYYGSWTLLIAKPDRVASLPIFLGPALTPALWIAGLVLLAEDRPLLPHLRPRLLFGGGALFLVAHVAHASLVWSRLP